MTRIYRGNKKEQLFKNLYVFGGCLLKIRGFCMDLETCFKVYNLVVNQLNNTKLGQMTNLNMIFYKLQLNPVPCSTSKWPTEDTQAGQPLQQEPISQSHSLCFKML